MTFGSNGVNSHVNSDGSSNGNGDSTNDVGDRTGSAASDCVVSRRLVLPKSSTPAQCSSFQSGHSYQLGDRVSNVGQCFECLVPGWCSNPADWAYKPGEGLHYTEAWVLIDTLDNIDSNSSQDSDVGSDADNVVNEGQEGNENDASGSASDMESEQVEIVHEEMQDEESCLPSESLPQQSENNPVVPDPIDHARIQAAAALFREHGCDTCHGAKGEGLTQLA